jgi:hypothetical protein
MQTSKACCGIRERDHGCGVQETGRRQMVLLDVETAFDRLRLHAKPFEAEQTGQAALLVDLQSRRCANRSVDHDALPRSLTPVKYLYRCLDFNR